jgi:hypothetical protein
VKALTKEKKEKENVLTYLELINLKNVFLLQFEELRKNKRNINKVVHGRQGVSENSIAPINIVGKAIGTEEEFGFSWY